MPAEQKTLKELTIPEGARAIVKRYITQFEDTEAWEHLTGAAWQELDLGALNLEDSRLIQEFEDDKSEVDKDGEEELNYLYEAPEVD